MRAIRASRGTSSSAVEKPAEEMVTTYDPDLRTAGTSALQTETRISYGTDASDRAAATRPESNQTPASPVPDGRRSSNNIVEAALTRVKRATENASRAALPKIEPARSVSVPVDRRATAVALEPAPELEPRVEFAPRPEPKFEPRPEPRREIVPPAPIVKPAPAEVTTVAEAATAKAPADVAPEPPHSVLVLDELEPLDYLEAEIRKVDEKLGREFLKNESPPIFAHAVINIVDLLAVAVSSFPFLAIISIADGSFSVTRTKLASGAIVALIAFFYLALTQCLCGKTFGMMLTNTRVVDARAFEAPSPSQALVRTAGYFVAAAPALVGIIWAVFDQKHRGWQDFISRTVVVRDF